MREPRLAWRAGAGQARAAALVGSILLGVACAASQPAKISPSGRCTLVAEPSGGRELDYDSPDLRFTVRVFQVRGHYEHQEAVFYRGGDVLVAADVAVDVDVDSGDTWSGRVEAVPAAASSGALSRPSSPAASWACPAPSAVSVFPPPPTQLPGVFPPPASPPGTATSPR